MAAVADSQQQLAWEARQRPRAGLIAIASAVLMIGGVVLTAVSLQDIPRSSFLQSLGQAFKSGPIGNQPSLHIREFEYLDDHTLTFIGTGVIRALALVGLAWVVTFLALATRARRPDMSSLILYVALVGPVLAAIGSLLGAVGTIAAIDSFLSGPRTVDAARDALSSPVLIAASLLADNLAPLLVAAGLLLLALNAMRVGLLTRFLGILGMITGGLAVLTMMQTSQPLFAFVSTFWLLALAMLFFDRLPSGTPPAWRTGQAEPWPSQREVAEARRAGRSRATPERQPEPAIAGTRTARPHPSSKKRKRKRR